MFLAENSKKENLKNKLSLLTSIYTWSNISFHLKLCPDEWMSKISGGSTSAAKYSVSAVCWVGSVPFCVTTEIKYPLG